MTVADVELATVVVDCNEPYRLARFWADVLGYAPELGQGDWAALRSEGESGELEWVKLVGPPGAMPVAFQRVPEPRVTKNRLHLDLTAADEEAEASRVEGLGATRLRRSEAPDDVFVVLTDPEGNEFCIIRR
jgi:Glyoxalase-like domain